MRELAIRYFVTTAAVVLGISLPILMIAAAARILVDIEDIVKQWNWEKSRNYLNNFETLLIHRLQNRVKELEKELETREFK